MGIVVSFILITVGAIMRFAVSAQADGFDVHMVGVILLIVGVIGALLSIGFWASWGGFGNLTAMRQPRTVGTVERTVVHEREVP